MNILSTLALAILLYLMVDKLASTKKELDATRCALAAHVLEKDRETMDLCFKDRGLIPPWQR